MKIFLDNQSRINMNNEYTAKPSSTSNINKLTNEILPNIGDNKTYEGRKVSVEDFKKNLETMDVNVTQDAMTIASNTMSSEDYNRMIKEGENPLSMNAEDSVTILDRIKLYVAKSGTEIAGFTDTLDEETIKKMTGMSSIGGSEYIKDYDVEIDEDLVQEIVDEYNKISDITSMNDGMKLFFMTSDKDITLENLYLAKHSVQETTREQGSLYFSIETKGYLAKKASTDNDNQLQEEVKELLDNIEIPASEQNIENAKWLIKNSIMISPENLNKLEHINDIELPISDETFARMVLSALNRGDEPKEAILSNDKNIFSEAIMVTKKIEEYIDSETTATRPEEDDISKRRVLEEARLRMSVEANLMLLKKGISIDINNLQKYVEDLKKIEKTQKFCSLKEMTDVSETISDIKEAPAVMIGYFRKTIDTITLKEVRTKGNEYKAKFEEVMENYEKVWTEVRTDLGDSIKKAFRNVDDILSELNMPITDENRRAVRILGYNTIEINKDNLDEVKEADRKLQSVISRLTPSDTLSLIRKGKSPIEMSINELNEYLDEQENVQKEEIEKYSKYLFKLEHNNEITTEERESYIEVYRLLYQIEKTDLSAIGSVLYTGRELTMSNLKDALKTNKHKGMDIKVDDSFGFMVSDIRNKIEPEKLSHIEFTDEMPLEVMHEKLQQQAKDENLEKEWAKEQLREMREAFKAPDEVVNELMNNKVSVTAENLEAMYGLMKQRGRAFKRVLEQRDEMFEHKRTNFIEAMADKESANNAYADMIEMAQETVLNETLAQNDYLDVKALKLINLELSVSSQMSKCESYEVPVEIGGEMTSLNVKVVHNSSEEPNVYISFETENLGKVTSRLTVEEDIIQGYISSNLQEALTKLKEIADKLSNKVSVVYATNHLSDVKSSKIAMKDNDDEISTEKLYKTAKRFIEALKG